jgi:hypothetical protein
VSKVSTLRKVGAAARVAQQHAGRNRTVGAILSGVRTTARSFGKSLHQLWLEVTGTLFLLMAVFGGGAMVREYMKYTAGRVPSSHVVAALCFTTVFAWFGISSFWRVRKKG